MITTWFYFQVTKLARCAPWNSGQADTHLKLNKTEQGLGATEFVWASVSIILWLINCWPADEETWWMKIMSLMAAWVRRSLILVMRRLATSASPDQQPAPAPGVVVLFNQGTGTHSGSEISGLQFWHLSAIIFTILKIGTMPNEHLKTRCLHLKFWCLSTGSLTIFTIETVLNAFNKKMALVGVFSEYCVYQHYIDVNIGEHCRSEMLSAHKCPRPQVCEVKFAISPLSAVTSLCNECNETWH